ncbi:hypothetical protein [Amycolatopsis sp. WAC 01375]|uniref:hypothetical protein n=1 Tax=Amycolatopsis sp. WAC 01375 TaxID=2203194 RepID=UPI000F7A5288|nr:hypothetical protein [Amycolatopsis sp. WAC 01375]
MTDPIPTLPHGAVCFHEVTDSRPYRYGVVRFYRDNDEITETSNTYRVTVARDIYPDQSTARADVLTPSREWSHITDNPPSNWHSTTSPYSNSGTAKSPERGFTTLRRLADALAADAMHIIP